MILKAKPLAMIVVAILFGGIFFSSAMGWWQTETTKQAAVYTQGEFAGQANPADIRGSYTFGDVENNFNVPAELLAQGFGVESDDPAAFAVKSLEEMYLGSPEEIGTASVRLFVAFYLNLPMDLSTDMYLPESAAEILRSRSLSDEQTAYLEEHIVSFTVEPAAEEAPVSPEVESTPQPVITEEHDSSTDTTIKGKTTFADVMGWGVSQEKIELVLGIAMPAAPGIKIKDFCSQNGLDFETIRPALQAEVDQAK